VLKDTTSRGLCVRVRPPHTIERRGGGGGNKTWNLKVVSTPRISIGPAGCRINRDHAGYQDESFQLGAPGPGLERSCRHQLEDNHGMQNGHAKKKVGAGGRPGVRCRVEGRGDRERKDVCLPGACVICEWCE